MQRIKYGSKYDKSLGRVEIAKRIRADIKAAIKAGELPEGTYSVRGESYSMGRSINVRIIAPSVAVYSDEYLLDCIERPHEFTGRNRYSAQAEAVLDAVEAIVGAYNFDGSDSQSDVYHVNFSADVSFDHEWSRARREMQEARLLEVA